MATRAAQTQAPPTGWQRRSGRTGRRL